METKIQAVLDGLTDLEIAALASAHESMDGNGFDFGFADEVHVPDYSRQAMGALLTNLIKKKLIVWHMDYGQICYEDQQGIGDKYAVAEVIGKWLINHRPKH